MLTKQNKRIFGIAFLQLFATVLVISFLLPTLWMVSSSLKSSTEIFIVPIKWIPDVPRWKNYVDAFNLPSLPMWRFAWNTLIVVTLSVLGTVVSSVMVAYSFSRIQWPGRSIMFGLMLATLMLPGIVTLIPRFIMFRDFGWINYTVPGLDWYFPWLPLIVPTWFAAGGFSIFLMYQFFRGIPDDLDEAAKMDGAGRVQILTQILLPLCKPVLATIVVFALIQYYNEFMEPLIYLGKLEGWVLALGIRAFNDTNVQNWELVFSASTIMLIPVLFLFIVAQRYFVQGITMSGFGGR
jgi:ABC-type glycerol-3-phosphate transport system permease component